jgi:hypothetical protein
LTCAVLIAQCEPIDEIQLAHPQDVTDKRLHVGDEDIIANLPYHPGCRKWFDHHLLTQSNERPPAEFDGRYGLAPSAARVVYEYYAASHPELQRYEELLAETDRLDSAQLTVEDVLDPKGYILLGFTLDPRTGLGRYGDYFKQLAEWLRDRPIDEILAEPEVALRVERMKTSDAEFRRLTSEHTRLDGNVIVTDFRALDPVPVGNRFIVYTLFPDTNVSVRLQWGPVREGIVVSVGRSILNRTASVDVGALMARYGGGGHAAAGSCLLEPDTADARIAEIVAALKE